MTLKERADRGFNLHTKLVANVSAIRQLQLENYTILEEIEAEELYKDILGDDTAEFKAYLADVDIFYSRGKIARWKKIRKRLLTELELPIVELYNVPEVRLEQVAYFAKDADNARELLSKARVLLSLDWRNEIRILRGLPTTDECIHDPRPVDHAERCIKCGIGIKKIN